MARTSTASATWNGTLKEGGGRFEAGSGAFRGEYSFPTRFESQAGTNPEALIAAAHAREAKNGCPVSRALQGNVALELTATLET